MNKIIFSGNLGHSATVRDVPRGDQSGTQPVCNFSVAVRVGWGERQSTIWYDCSWWGERAAKVAQWLTKGRTVLVEGEPGLRLYQKRDKSTDAVIVVRVSALDLIGPGAHVDESTPAAAAPAAVGAAVSGPAQEKVDDDVPF